MGAGRSLFRWARGPATLLVAAAALTACAARSNANVPSDLAGKSANEILATTRSAAVAKGWVRIDVHGKFGASNEAEVVLAGTTTGSQALNASGAQGVLRLVGSTLYVLGNATYLKNNFATAHSAWAGRWVSIPPSAPEFDGLASTVRIDSAISPQSPASHPHVLGTVRYQGQRAIEIEGVATSTAGEITITTYLAYASPHLPIAETAAGTSGGQKVALVASYTRWGVPFVIVAPPSSTPIAATDLRP
jgi:hypothetical protein